MFILWYSKKDYLLYKELSTPKLKCYLLCEIRQPLFVLCSHYCTVYAKLKFSCYNSIIFRNYVQVLSCNIDPCRHDIHRYITNLIRRIFYPHGNRIKVISISFFREDDPCYLIADWLTIREGCKIHHSYD